MNKNRYIVRLVHTKLRYRCDVVIAERRFKSLESAERWADKINAKHCRSTYYEKCSKFVEICKIHKVKEKQIEELNPVFVPSVGDLGYW